MRALYLASVWLHILAAATWVGGMVVFVVAVMPYFRQQDEHIRAAFLDWFGRRFRVVSWTCFTALAATGSFNLWMRGVRLGDFARLEWIDTTFGRLVVAKLALVVVVVGLTAAHERFAYAPAGRWLGRSLLGLALVIVAAAVMLVRAL